MIKNEDMTAYEVMARRFFYLLFTTYVAFIVIFAKQHNDIIANLMGVAMVGFFIAYQIIFSKKTFYLNSMLVLYFIFYLVCALSVTWSIDVDYSRYTVMRMTQLFINLVFLYNILKTFKIHEAVFTGLMIGTLFNALLAVGVISVDSPIYWARRFIGTTMISNTIGAMALFSLFGSIFILQNAKNYLWIFIHVVNILAAYYIIILTASRSSLVISSLVVFIFMVQLLLNKTTRVYLLLFAGLIFLLILSLVDLSLLYTKVSYAFYRLSGIFGTLDGQSADSSTTERFLFLKITVAVFLDNPLFGTGVNTTRVFLNGFYAHNNYIEILATTGLLGWLIYYSIFIHLIWKTFQVKEFWTRNYIFLFTLVLLLYDMAAVTFYIKLTLLIILLLHYMAEEKSK
ncbi:MAG TPA: hypothetical protein EYG93_07350 [Sulfurospirillum arcachonense]|nr:hypothetical protein [Sulfurospirillum arcachonense]